MIEKKASVYIHSTGRKQHTVAYDWILVFKLKVLLDQAYIIIVLSENIEITTLLVILNINSNGLTIKLSDTKYACNLKVGKKSSFD